MFTLPNFIAFRADIDERIIDNLNKVAKHNNFLIGHNRTVQSVKEKSEDNVIAEGNTPAELKHFLLSRMTHEELVKFASEK